MTEKKYVRNVFKHVMCGGKRKKELYKSFLELVIEKKEEGMDIESIISEMGEPEEVAEEINVYLSEKNLLVNRIILNVYNGCKYANILAFVIAILIFGSMFVKQYKILRFVYEHQDASAYFFASPLMLPVQISGLIVLIILIIALFIIRGVLKRKYMG